MGFLGRFLAMNFPGLIPERIDPKGRATLCDLEVVRPTRGGVFLGISLNRVSDRGSVPTTLSATDCKSSSKSAASISSINSKACSKTSGDVFSYGSVIFRYKTIMG